MNSIKEKISNIVLKRSHEHKLRELAALLQEDVTRQFNMNEADVSYWIDCADEYAKEAEFVDQAIEIDIISPDSCEFITGHWEFFSESIRAEFDEILLYVIHLRNLLRRKSAKSAVFQSEVRDNIYEM